MRAGGVSGARDGGFLLRRCACPCVAHATTRRAGMGAAAEEEENKQRQNAGENFVDFVRRQDREAASANEKKKGRYLSARARAIATSIHEIMNHKVFDAGAKLHDFECGFKQNLIKLDLSLQDARREADKLFGYDHKVIPTCGRMPFFQSLSSRSWWLLQALRPHR